MDWDSLYPNSSARVLDYGHAGQWECGINGQVSFLPPMACTVYLCELKLGKGPIYGNWSLAVSVPS